jgi:hypothetical protein
MKNGEEILYFITHGEASKRIFPHVHALLGSLKLKSLTQIPSKKIGEWLFFKMKYDTVER